MTGENEHSINSSDLEFRFILPIFFKLIDSIRYAKNNNPIYMDLQQSIKLKTTEEIHKIAYDASVYFLLKLREDRDKYSNNRHAVEKLKHKAIKQAI